MHLMKKYLDGLSVVTESDLILIGRASVFLASKMRETDKNFRFISHYIKIGGKHLTTAIIIFSLFLSKFTRLYGGCSGIKEY